MNRLSFSRQPTAWIGVISAVVAFAAVLGLHAPQGFEAAAAGVVTAAGAAITWTQVRPAGRSIDVGIAPIVHVSAESPGSNEHEYRRYVNGRLEQRNKTSFTTNAPNAPFTIATDAPASRPLVPPVPIKAHPKPPRTQPAKAAGTGKRGGDKARQAAKKKGAK